MGLTVVLTLIAAAVVGGWWWSRDIFDGIEPDPQVRRRWQHLRWAADNDPGIAGWPEGERLARFDGELTTMEATKREYGWFR